MGEAPVMVDIWGQPILEHPEIEDMIYPVKHIMCGKIHDAAGGVEVVGRYSDCTRWVCPKCGWICDDRPIGWGGNIVKLKER